MYFSGVKPIGNHHQNFKLFLKFKFGIKTIGIWRIDSLAPLAIKYGRLGPSFRVISIFLEYIVAEVQPAPGPHSPLQLPDHELFSISLETLLSTHFMYGDPEWHTRCVASARTSNMLGETQDENRRHKKFSGYVVYVAYR